MDDETEVQRNQGIAHNKAASKCPGWDQSPAIHLQCPCLEPPHSSSELQEHLSCWHILCLVWKHFVILSAFPTLMINSYIIKQRVYLSQPCLPSTHRKCWVTLWLTILWIFDASLFPMAPYPAPAFSQPKLLIGFSWLGLPAASPQYHIVSPAPVWVCHLYPASPITSAFLHPLQTSKPYSSPPSQGTSPLPLKFTWPFCSLNYEHKQSSFTSSFTNW